MTDGILLREFMSDPLLTQYSILMVDEAHERSINTDIILGLLRKVIMVRQDLRIIVSSATLDATLFRDFFELNDTSDKSKDITSIISVEGHIHPVTIYYTRNPVPDYIQKTVETILDIHKNEQPGDILVFLTGQDEACEVESVNKQLFEAAKDLRKKEVDKLWIVPMYGSLPGFEQLKAFDSTPYGTRKIVVATNIAETSLTIPGITYVIDCGFVKLRVMNPENYFESLMKLPISQASAQQRTGRAGRIRPGKCYRLYPQEEYDKLLPNTIPEMQRLNLAAVILLLKALGIHNVLRFNYLSRPPSFAMVEGLQSLYYLGALSKDGLLTNPLGIQMTDFPLPPQHSKTLLCSGELGCSEEIATIIAMLQIQDVFVIPSRYRHEAELMKRNFSVEEGDHFTLLNVFTNFMQNGKSKQWCINHFLNYRGLCRAQAIRDQLLGLLRHHNIPIKSCKENGELNSVLRCLVKGFFSQAAYYHYSGDYVTIRNEHHFKIYKGSAIMYKREFPKWVIFTEVLQDSIRDVSVIEPEWLYQLVPEYYEFGTQASTAATFFTGCLFSAQAVCIACSEKASEIQCRQVSQNRFKNCQVLKVWWLCQQSLFVDGPGLDYFISKASNERLSKVIPRVEEMDESLIKFITYGCQMNINDVELVRSLLLSSGYVETDDVKEADIILLMTCSIREGAENKVWDELKVLRKIRRKKGVVGVLGCMAERVRHNLLTCTENVDVVAGPDSYRDLPRLLAIARCGSMAINVQLSLEETYADVVPVRKDKFSKTAFVSIMRGCDNMCTYCIVPYTRGRERSRPMNSILDEIRRLSDEGVKQVTLLGQNVNSYRDLSEISFLSASFVEPGVAPGFRTKYKPKRGGYTFLTLLDKVSQIDSEMRIRFTSPHPKDFPLEVIQLIKERPNICKQIHLPAQSGSNIVLDAMDRGYSRESYLELVDRIKTVLPNVSLTSDFIAGFCGETEECHRESLDLIKHVVYSFCYVFPYSQREKTKAYRHLRDDVPKEVKDRRHQELASAFRETALKHNEALVGTKQLVLLEETSKRSSEHLRGRIDGGVSVIIHKYYNDGSGLVELKPGDYVVVKITSANSQTLQALTLQTIKLKDFENL
ncbi:CDK5 regulatory subunit-associated protein 1 [Wuchereria bancrofti]|uniref:CDK5RAP1-like protein n=1 Tax=Wuchereria bancrofti TaxID=6293 RepID=J9ESW0_WUCBA|nr:CDK5 regulatory subunit-associated protein 1 [Wuchereria bancrofti]